MMSRIDASSRGQHVPNEEPELNNERDIPTEAGDAASPAADEASPAGEESVAGEEDPGAALDELAGPP